MSDGSGVTSFQHLREVQEKEKNNQRLSAINETFFADARAYVEGKEGTRQAQNAADILDHIMNLRLQKLFHFALLGENLPSDPDNMTEQEEELFDKLTLVTDELKWQLVNSHETEDAEVVETSDVGEAIEHETESEAEDAEMEEMTGEREEGVEERERADGEDPADPVQVRIKGDVPAFLGIDLKNYGPYAEDDVAEIPRKNASVLFHHGKAEKL